MATTNTGIGVVPRGVLDPIHEGYAQQYYSKQADAYAIASLFPVIQAASIASVQEINLTNYALDLQTNPEVLNGIDRNANATAPLKQKKGKISYMLERRPTGSIVINATDRRENAAKGIDVYRDAIEQTSVSAMSLVAYEVGRVIQTQANYDSGHKSELSGLSATTDWAKKLEDAAEKLLLASTWASGVPLKVVVGKTTAQYIRMSNQCRDFNSSQYKDETQNLTAVADFIKKFLPTAEVLMPDFMYINTSGTMTRMFSTDLAIFPAGQCSLGKLIIPAGSGAFGENSMGSMLEVGEDKVVGADAVSLWTAAWFQPKLAIDASATETKAGFYYYGAALA